jgi:bifunctional DNA-binding transcriptional regulator/antitoxin component of YhaV-PrlF toxin-antitoxin module
MQREIWNLVEVMHMHYHIHMDENELESSLTDRYQTTVPARIRKLLGLNKRDKLEWILDESGGVRVTKRNPEGLEHTDPTVDAWLDFVAELSGERGVGVEGLPPTLEELWAQEDDAK